MNVGCRTFIVHNVKKSAMSRLKGWSIAKPLWRDSRIFWAQTELLHWCLLVSAAAVYGRFTSPATRIHCFGISASSTGEGATHLPTFDLASTARGTSVPVFHATVTSLPNSPVCYNTKTESVVTIVYCGPVSLRPRTANMYSSSNQLPQHCSGLSEGKA